MHSLLKRHSDVASLRLRVHEEVGFMLPFRLYARKPEQGEGQITYFDKHSMQSGLVNDWAREDGFSIVHHGDSQSIKPIRPFRVKMPLDDNLVDLKALVFRFPFLFSMLSFLLSRRQGNLLGSLSAHSSLVSGSSNDTTARGDEEGDAVGERRTFPMVWFSESVVVLAGVRLRLPQTGACD